jgi:hypothetical protein
MLSQSESQNTNENETKKVSKNEKELYYVNKYNEGKNIETVNLNTLESLLEKEKQKSKNDQWNKIDKTTKIQLLHGYAERYGNENSLPVKEIKNLKMFFTECLNKGKLSKNKDISYIKETQHITAIPALHFNKDKKSFTLRIIDNKRVSTLKSLTPKKNK